MIENGFKTNECDKCIYHKSWNNSHVIICLYVDDLLIFGSNMFMKLKMFLETILI